MGVPSLNDLAVDGTLNTTNQPTNQLTLFVKHIFDFSQTAAQISMKFGSYMHLGKVTQVCSNQGCMTYFH